MLSRKNLEIYKITDKKDEYSLLSGVLITPEYTCASDKKRLLMVTNPSEVDPEDFPVDYPVGKIEHNSVIPAKVAEAVTKLVPKNPPIPILNYIAIKEEMDEKNEVIGINFTAGNLESKQTIRSRVFDGIYPNIERIFPKEEPRFSVRIDGKLLKELLSFFDTKFGKEKYYVELHFWSSKDPILLHQKEEQEIYGLLMPLVGGEEELKYKNPFQKE